MKEKGKREIIMDKTIREIADYYGLDSQSRRCSEECAELIVALSKLRRDDTGASCAKYDVAEEIADVSIMIMQIMYLLDIPNEQVDEIFEEKLKRERDRINREKMLKRERKTMKSINENQCDYKENSATSLETEEGFTEIHIHGSANKQPKATIYGKEEDIIAYLAFATGAIVNEVVKKGQKRSTVEQNVIETIKSAIVWSRAEVYDANTEKGTNNAENKPKI